MIDRRAPEPATEFRNQLELALTLAICGDGCEKIPRIGETVGADRAELRQSQQRAVVLADIAARIAATELDREADAARDDGNLSRCNIDNAHLGVNLQRATLGDEQQLAVRIVEESVPHRP